jgi:hypothetical protein
MIAEPVVQLPTSETQPVPAAVMIDEAMPQPESKSVLQKFTDLSKSLVEKHFGNLDMS